MIAQSINFAIVLFVLWRFAYKPVFNVLEARRQKIAEGIANAEKIKAELAKTEADRKAILAEAGEQANKMIEEARAAAMRVREMETQKAITAAEQIIIKAREAAAQDHARMLAELKREVGRLVVQTTATVTGKILTPEDQRGWPRKRRNNWRDEFRICKFEIPTQTAGMKISKQAQRDARQLFRSCQVNGLLDESRVRQAVALLRGKEAARLRRNFVAAAPAGEAGSGTAHRPRGKRDAAARRFAGAGRGPAEKIYGDGLDLTFAQNPSLIGGLRIQVGSDLYDGSVKMRLEKLEQSF